MAHRALLLALLTSACAGAAACGGDSSTASTFSPIGPGSGGAPTTLGAGGAGGASSSSTSSSSSSASTSSSTSSSSTSSSSSSGAGTTCDAPNTCDTALELSSIDGDQNSDTRTLSGYTSRWLKVLVTDSSSYAINGHESYTVTLESPPGMLFDLYVYAGDSNAPNCLAAAVSGTGSPESFTGQWGDSFGTDDNRWIAFEVRSVSNMPCTSSAEWKLTVVGNTMP